MTDLKRCYKCQVEQSKDGFVKCRRNIDGLAKRCKKCSHDIYIANQDHIKAKSRTNALKNKEKIKERSRLYREQNSERLKQRAKSYRDQNKDIIAKRKADYAKKNRDKLNKYLRDYKKSRESQDIVFSLNRKIRRRMWYALKKKKGSGQAIDFLGCSIDFLKGYLESKFQPGMTWENNTYTGWHIDHIVPLSAFDLTDVTQLKLACHYTNLQPLWAKDNLRKSDRIL
jgi:hypothetical protein